MADEAAEPEVEEEEEEEDDEPAEFRHHAMFPRDDDAAETRDIVWIQLLRMLPDGTVQTCPDQFQASDLPHWGEVYRRFGGGKYRAKGRNAKMQWQAESPGGSDWHVFDGASKPFAVNPVEMAAVPAPPAPPVPVPPPPPPAHSGPGLAEAITALGGVISTVATALINRPAPAAAPAPDNSLAVAMMNNMAAQAQANAKAQSDVLVALLSRDNKPDNSAMVAVLNASAETTRAQAAAQNTLLTAVLTQKQPALADLADVLTKLGRNGTQQTGGIKDTIETIKAVREISGPAQAAPGGTELGDVTSLVTSLAALDKGSGGKDKDNKDREEPKPRPRNRILMRTAMGLVEVVDPSPELLRQLAAPAPTAALGGSPAVAAPAPAAAPVVAAPVPVAAPVAAPAPAAAPAVAAQVAAAPAPASAPAPGRPASPPPGEGRARGRSHRPKADAPPAPAPLSEDEELAQLAAKFEHRHEDGGPRRLF